MFAAGCAAEGAKGRVDAGSSSAAAVRGPGWAQDGADAVQAPDLAPAPEQAPDARPLRQDAVSVVVADAWEPSRDVATVDAWVGDAAVADAWPVSDGPPAPLPDGDGYNRSADCDPYANTGCPDGYKCAIRWGKGGGYNLACMGYGAGRVTEACNGAAAFDTCAPGLTCSTSSGKGKCFEFCPVSSWGKPCPTSGKNMTCGAYSNNGQTIAFCSQP